MGLLQQIAVKTLQFSRLRSLAPVADVDEVKKLVSQLTLIDCHFDARAALFPVEVTSEMVPDVAPVTYTHVYEDQHMHMSIFGLRAHSSMPLHNHPGMFGFMKVLYGRVAVNCYSKLDSLRLPATQRASRCFKQRLASWQEPTVIPVVLESQHILDAASDALVLTPTSHNLHELVPVGQDEAVFFDLLTPPYLPGERDCAYFQKLDPVDDQSRAAVPAPAPQVHGGNKVFWLSRIGPPAEYYCEEVPHLGERIDLDDLLYANN